SGFVVWPPQQGPPPVVEASGNLFDLRCCAGGAPFHADMLDRIRWKGRNNAYVRLAPWSADKINPAALERWSKLLGTPEEGSREVILTAERPWLYRREAFLSRDFAASRDILAQELAALREKPGHADLGPDLAAIGPGEPYWKTLAKPA